MRVIVGTEATAAHRVATRCIMLAATHTFTGNIEYDNRMTFAPSTRHTALVSLTSLSEARVDGVALGQLEIPSSSAGATFSDRS